MSRRQGARALQWQLQWSRWYQRNHDWVGPRLLGKAKGGEVPVKRAPRPKVHREHFPSEAEARERIAQLQRLHPIDELAYSILPPADSLPAPIQLTLATAWSEQRR
jgi:hypothetical protein